MVTAHYRSFLLVPTFSMNVNFYWIVNNLIVRNLLINYLKNFPIFRGKHLCWSVLLIKLQTCNFPLNFAKLFLGTALKILNNLKRKQTFYFTWISFLLMKHKLINFYWIANNLIVRNLLINYLNLIKGSIQKQLPTEQMFFEVGVLKNFAIFRGNHLCWCVFLIKL